MRTIGRWWNGSYGRLARRWIWLRTDGEFWQVEARQGNDDARIWSSRPMVSESDARQLLRQMMDRTGDDWRDMGPG